MKKLVVAAVAAVALSAPALADGRGPSGDIHVDVNISNENSNVQIGAVNANLAIQNAAGELEIDHEAFNFEEPQVDLGDLRYLNNAMALGDNSSIGDIVNVNDEVDGSINNGSGDLTEVDIDIEDNAIAIGHEVVAVADVLNDNELDIIPY